MKMLPCLSHATSVGRSNSSPSTPTPTGPVGLGDRAHLLTRSKFGHRQIFGCAAEHHLHLSLRVEFHDRAGPLVDGPDVVLRIDANCVCEHEPVKPLADLAHVFARWSNSNRRAAPLPRGNGARSRASAGATRFAYTRTGVRASWSRRRRPRRYIRRREVLSARRQRHTVSHDAKLRDKGGADRQDGRQPGAKAARAGLMGPPHLTSRSTFAPGPAAPRMNFCARQATISPTSISFSFLQSMSCTVDSSPSPFPAFRTCRRPFRPVPS